MGVTTKTGDGGMTALLSGARVGKDDIRIEAVGCFDELSSFLGFAKLLISEPEQAAIHGIQTDLLTVCGYFVSLEDGVVPQFIIGNERVLFLEEGIQKLEAAVPKRQSFVIPGANESSARLDLARASARKCERVAYSVGRRFELHENVRQYINRLSDYLFLLARKQES